MAERNGRKGHADVPDAVVQFLTAEHFTLQGARATTITEANGRQQTYLSVLSAVILALAFIAQVTRMSSTFFAFALVLLPLVYFLGVATMERVHQIWGEWLLYQMGLNRIRRFYVEVEPDLQRYFVLPTTDDRTTSLESLGIPDSWWRWAVGISGMIAVVNSIVAGVLVGLAAYQAGATATIAPWLAGAGGFAVSLALLRLLMLRAQRRHAARLAPGFPDPLEAADRPDRPDGPDRADGADGADRARAGSMGPMG